MTAADGERPGGSQRPRLEPTKGSALVVAALAAFAVSWLLISRFYGDLPRLPWAPAAFSGVLALLEGFLAVQTRARIERRPGREPVAPLAVARFVVLAKASSMTGAVLAGLYGGALAWLAVEQARLGATEARAADLPIAATGTTAALALIGTALWLERACRVPPGDDDPKKNPPTD
ncbi:DUF3180 domain-containing protein [Pilimelia columellifera]|uniref:DUF3180 domain-containing protein n=1 Tax=Pilimelia columellifera TaxID=706574 RepID=UPI003CD09D10